MFTPIGNYMEPVNNDFINLINYLEKYYKKKLSDKKKQILKMVHKHVWITMIWKEKLLNTHNEYINDMILDLFSIIHSCVIGDLKVINFLIRNLIEDFIKYCKIYYNEIDCMSMPRDIFSIIFSKTKNDDFIHNNYSIIKSIYSDMCLTVHSANIDSFKICDSLIKYDKLYADDEILNDIEKLDKVFRAMNNINCVKQIKKFVSINIDIQSIVRDYMKSSDIDELYKRV